MSTHLSTRITWHDRGWDGHVCDCPVENSSCLVHRHVREARDDRLEMRFRGRALDDLDGWLPPCSRDLNAFSAESFRIVHQDPLKSRGLPSVVEELLPFSVCPAPFRWMREEYVSEILERHQFDLPPREDPARQHGWVNEPERQRLLLGRFWGELEVGRSLIFFYCNHGNPIEGGPSRLLVGVSRISEVGAQLMFGNKPGYSEDYPVWSRRVSHAYPSQGVRLPLQEYLDCGHPLGGLVRTAPESAGIAFSHVAEHVCDDLAIGTLERFVQAVEAVKHDALLSGDWDQALAWLDDALADCWKERGLLPGIGSVFRALGMSRGVSLQRAELTDPRASRTELWEKAAALLDGSRDPHNEAAFLEGLAQARARWRALPAPRRELLAVLARFELSPEQVSRLSEPRKREASGVRASEEEILANPYLIFEQDHGTARSSRVALETIDRGVVLDPGRFSEEEPLPLDDLSRIRASAVDVLEHGAEEGHTVLGLEELLDGVEQLFPERRRCVTDVDLVIGSGEFLGDALHFERERDESLVALPRLSEDERRVRELVERRWQRVNDVDDLAPAWPRRIAAQFDTSSDSSLADGPERRAQREKVEALRILYRRRLSVLTGRAGTGKTSVLRTLLDGIEASEGRGPVLLLAPTGKARVRLATATGRPAQTIHQFLLRNRWLAPDTLRIRDSGGRKQGAATVVLDEASMVPIDLLGALFAALDMNVVRRLILVGDPNQLPPIGPGRPFLDLISWLEDEEHPERRVCLAALAERARHADVESRALALADGYLRDTPPAGSDELLAELARGESGGDLAIEFYDGVGELREHLWSVIDQVIERGAAEPADEALRRSLGADGPTGERAEAWQLLSPVRVGSSGTDDLNRQIQQRFKRGSSNRRGRAGKGALGDEDIVQSDKVMQVRNRARQAWPAAIGADYVANGEIGIVTDTSLDGHYLEVAYSTQPEVSYRYYGEAVNDELRLAYAVTVHKAQGSDFDTVILLLPAGAGTLSRELLYTALTRFRKRMILLVEKDVSTLVALRRPERSDVVLRNTNLFEVSLGSPERRRPFAHRLIHQASNGTLVRSKSELVIVETLLRLGMSVEYEQRLESPYRLNDFRLPDFTVMFEGDVFYWEHLGMLDVASYARSWRRKRSWYEENGFLDRLITSVDSGGLHVPSIEARAERRILRGEQRGADEPGFD